MTTKLKETSDLLGRIQDHYGIIAIVPARILIMLAHAGDGGIMQVELSDDLGYGRDSTTVQTAVDRLVKKGVVIKQRTFDGDHHGVHLRLAEPFPKHLLKA